MSSSPCRPLTSSFLVAAMAALILCSGLVATLGVGPVGAATTLNPKSHFNIVNGHNAGSDSGTYLWVVNSPGGSADDYLYHYNRTTGAQVGAPLDLPVNSACDSVYASATRVWIACETAHVVITVDATTNSFVHGEDVGGSPKVITPDGLEVWVANYGNNNAVRIGPDGTVDKTVAMPGQVTQPMEVLSDGTYLYVTGASDNYIYKLQISDGSVLWSYNTDDLPHTPSLDSPWGMALVGNHLWVGMIWIGAVFDFNTATGAFIKKVRIGDPQCSMPYTLGRVGKQVIVSDLSCGTTTVLNGRTGAIIATPSVTKPAKTSGALAMGRSGFWVLHTGVSSSTAYRFGKQPKKPLIELAGATSKSHTQSFDLTVNLGGEKPPTTVAFSGTVPPGLRLTKTAGVWHVTGQITAVGRYRLGLTSTNGAGTRVAHFTLKVT